MKQNFKFILVAAAAIAMVGCDQANNQTEEPAVEKGSKTYATVRITQNATRAENDWAAASDSEADLNDAQLFVFNANDELESITELATTGVTPFETYTGEHTLFVLANIPDALAGDITAFITLAEIEESKEAAENGEGELITDPATSLETFKEKTLALADKAAIATYTGANDFFMTNFGDEEVVMDFVAPEDEDDDVNDVAISLGRAVAKVSMLFITSDENTANNVIMPAEGVVSGVTYKVINNPNTMYMAQHFDGTVVKTPYHDVQGETPVAANYYETDYVTAAVVASAPETGIYIPENTNGTVVREGEISALMIKGTFTATAVKNADGTDGTVEAGQDLYRIIDLNKNKEYKTFYVASPDLAVIKDALGLAFVDPDPIENTNYTIKKWTAGLCYYRLPLMNDAYTEGDPVRYNILRNDWFRVDINSISDIGGNSESDVTPPDPTPVTVPISVNATITVQPWTPVNQGGNL
jgi:hypothetical protein